MQDTHKLSGMEVAVAEVVVSLTGTVVVVAATLGWQEISKPSISMNLQDSIPISSILASVINSMQVW
jgi:hypothetical protein